MNKQKDNMEIPDPPIRPKSGFFLFYDEKIDKYRDSGMSLREIAKEVKMNHESVRRHLQNRVKLLAK